MNEKDQLKIALEALIVLLQGNREILEVALATHFPSPEALKMKLIAENAHSAASPLISQIEIKDDERSEETDSN